MQKKKKKECFDYLDLKYMVCSAKNVNLKMHFFHVLNFFIASNEYRRNRVYARDVTVWGSWLQLHPLSGRKTEAQILQKHL